MYNRWVHNFLIPLCASDGSAPAAFCTAWNVFPFQKRTVLDIGQAIMLLRVGCDAAKEKLHDILTLSWPLFCAKYPCKRPLWLLAPPAAEEPAAEAPEPDKNVTALLKLSDYLNGAPLEDDDLASPIRRLCDNAALLRNGGFANISYGEALDLLDYYNTAYNADGDGSPISLGDDDEELFLREEE